MLREIYNSKYRALNIMNFNKYLFAVFRNQVEVRKNNPIPYTFCLHSSALSAKSVFHYIFKETLRKKKSKKIGLKNFAFAQAKLHNASTL